MINFGSKTQLAQQLGISWPTLSKRAKEHGIDLDKGSLSEDEYKTLNQRLKGPQHNVNSQLKSDNDRLKDLIEVERKRVNEANKALIEATRHSDFWYNETIELKQDIIDLKDQVIAAQRQTIAAHNNWAAKRQQRKAMQHKH